MTSKSSFFNILKVDMKRRNWLLVVSSSIFLFCLPFFAAFFITNSIVDYERSYMAAQQNINEYLMAGLKRYYYGGVINTITVFLAVLCSVQGFGYLFSKQKVDLYHSLPVKREKLFFSVYLNGLMIYIVPFAVSLVLTAVISSGFGLLNQEMMVVFFHIFGLHVLNFTAVYHLMIVVIMLTGNRLVTVLGGITAVFYFPLLLQMLVFLQENFIPEIYTGGAVMDKFWYSSPLFSYAALHNLMEDISYSSYYNASIMQMISLIGIMSLVCFGLALYLYKKRPSESAEKAIAFPIIRPVIKIMVMFLFAVLGGAFMLSIAYRGRSFWFYSGIVLGAVISHCLMEIIFEFDVKAVFRSLKSALVGLGLAIAVCVVFQFDLFSLADALPAQNKVVSAAVSIEGIESEQGSGIYLENYDFYRHGYGYMNVRSYQLKNMKLHDTEIVYKLADIGKASKNQEDGTETVTCIFKLIQKNGMTVSRKYNVPYNSETEELFSKLFSSEEFKYGTYSVLNMEAGEVEAAACMKNVERNEKLNLTQEETAELLEIYKEELLALALEDLKTELPVNELAFFKEGENQTATGLVYSSFHNTIEFLTKCGIGAAILDAERIKSIEVVYHSQTENAANSNIMIYETVKTRTDHSILYIEKEQIKELSKYLLPSSYAENNRVLLPICEELEFRVELQDERGNTGVVFMHIPRKYVPEFLKKSIADMSL